MTGNANRTKTGKTAAPPTSVDGLLDHRVKIEQSTDGYRVAIDTVLLAAAVPAGAGQRILDLGSGVGGVMLCLACRVPGVAVTGVEIQDDLVGLCRGNIARNAFKAGLDVRQGDATQLPADLCGVFDHAVMNPPYHDEGRHDASGDFARRTAYTEKEGDMTLWLASAAKSLGSSGMLTLIHRADRLEEIEKSLARAFGAVEVLPVLPRAGALPKRVIVRARKGGKSVIKRCKSFILHGAGSGYTDEAEAVLRHANPLAFAP